MRFLCLIFLRAEWALNLLICTEKTLRLKKLFKINIQSNIQAQCIFSEDINKTQITTFEGTGTVEILPVEKYEPTTVMIKSCPCSGSIESVDPVTGTITYLPGGPPPAMDTFQYTMEDECAVTHCITQHVCQQMVPSPPFINLACKFENSVALQVFPLVPEVFDIKPFVVEGSTPTDYSTLIIKELKVFATGSQLTFADCPADIPVLPYDFPCNMGQGIGCPYSEPTAPFQTFINYTQTTNDSALVNYLQFVTPGVATWTVSHDNNGVITATGNNPYAVNNLSTVTQVMQILYCVSNAAGASNTGCLFVGASVAI